MEALHNLAYSHYVEACQRLVDCAKRIEYITDSKTKLTKCSLDFLREMGREIPRGIGFGSPDACECSQYAPDAGSADILKNRKNPEVFISPKTTVVANMMLLWYQNDKPQRRK